MAKKNHNRQPSVKADGRKAETIIKVIAVLFVLIFAAYITLSLVFHSWNPVRWTDIRQTQTNPGDAGNTDTGTGDEDGNDTADNQTTGSILNVTEERGIKLTSARISTAEYEEYGISPQADSAYTIKATVNSDAVVKQLIWGSSFKNAASTWASGKKVGDYCSMTVSEDTLSVVLSFSQAFGEPIVIRASSYEDSRIYTECQIDYLMHITSFTVKFNDVINTSYSAGSIYVGGTDNVVLITPTYGTGTVKGTISNISTTLNFRAEMVTAINTNFKNGSGTSSFTFNSSVTREGNKFDLPIAAYPHVIYTGGGNENGAVTIINNYFVTNGYDANGNGSPMCVVDGYSVSFDYNYDGAVMDTSSKAFTGYVPIRNAGLTKIATVSEINFDKSSIVVY